MSTEESKAVVEKQQQETATTKILAPESTIDGEFGDLGLINSAYKTERVFSKMTDVTPENEGKEIWIRARVQTVRGKGKLCFLMLRDRYDTCQAYGFAGPEESSIEMIKYASKITPESWVDVFGVVKKADVQSCSQREAEISIKKIFVVSAASNRPPFTIADAMGSNPNYNLKPGQEPTEDKFITISQNVRFDNRSVDLRTPANQAIFTIQSRIGQFFREFLYKHNFIEIHTPKIVPGVSEGHLEIFSLDYFGNKCFLAQSPQLYKQMVTVSDFDRVFEIGHVFRAEQGNTHRHLCEFTGLNLEKTFKEHYHEVRDLICELFIYIFNRLNETSQKEIAAVNSQYPFEPLQVQEKVVCITFNEAYEMLVTAGEVEKVYQGPLDSMTTTQEHKLGKLMKEKYGCELYIIDKYPSAIRPFYTMPDPVDQRYSNSYEIFLRGQEISSGGQRIHDHVLLKQRIKERNIPLDGLKSYIETFEHGALPHAGCGIGLERMTFLFLDLKNIRLSTLFPRDPHRSTP